MESPELNLLRYGHKYSPSRQVGLSAGELRAYYSKGEVLRVKTDNFEVIRRIYAAVRDRNWKTLKPEVLREYGSGNDEHYVLTRSCEYRENDIHFLADYTITSGNDNRIIFSMEGVAESTFLKNRIGICVLHPLKGYKGRDCIVVTPEGKQVSCRFPEDVSPHQPMKNIRSLRWTIPGNATVTLHFEGDVFEMEDQRNWTDASFKIYSTPLEKPYPEEIKKGDTISQRVILELTTGYRSGQGTSLRSNTVQFDPGHQGIAFPGIGLCRSTEQMKLTTEDEQRIAETGFDHYRVELYLFRPGWQDEFMVASEESSVMKLPLELALYVSSAYDREIKEFLGILKIHNPALCRLMVFREKHVHDEVITGSLLPLLKNALDQVPVGTGTDANFAELNRYRPDTKNLDFVTFAVCPQMHATDHQTLFENLEAQAEVVKSARLFSRGKDVCIAAVTLKRRFNIVATAPETTGMHEQLPPQVDTRQVSLLCSAWTLGSIKYLGEQGVRSISFYETVGRKGVIHGDFDPLTPELFHAGRNDLYPVWFLFRELHRYKSWTVIPSESVDPLVFLSLVLRKGDNYLLALANVTDRDMRVYWPHSPSIVPSRGWSLNERTLDALRQGENIWKSMDKKRNIQLLPYATVLIEATC